MLFKYKEQCTDDDLNDKVVKSKKLFQFEEWIPNESDKLQRRFGELAAEVDGQFSKYLNIINPKDCDLNYNRIYKLNHEWKYDIINEQIKKLADTQEIFKIFDKKNKHINYFLSDVDQILENKDLKFDTI